MQPGRYKVKSSEELAEIRVKLAESGLRVVFTNGCFDILHVGHLRYLETARDLGDILIVAVNSDASVRRIKGAERPIVGERERVEMVAGLHCVDYATLFSEETPFQIIERLQPDVLAKGGDWPKEQIVGRDIVERRGGQVVTIEFERGYSTSGIIDRIRRSDRMD
jgi:D-beta-D-heptose 7-phosphate kinase/D-beta-D-heptose 1-phosphate adenosyltransferase